MSRFTSVKVRKECAVIVMKSHRCVLGAGEVFCAAEAELSSVVYLAVAAE